MKRYVILLLALVALCANAQRIQRCENGRYGIAVRKSNGNFKWLAKPNYTFISQNSDGSYSVSNPDGKWGVVSASGNEVVECTYQTKDAAMEAYKQYKNPTSKQTTSNYRSDTKNMKEGLNPDFTLTRDYTPYIKRYVESKINVWQKKGEFEKTADYQKRVNEFSRKEMVEKFAKEVCDECLKKVQDKELIMTLGEYDADNETFLITTGLGRIVVSVPIDKAPKFKSQWRNIKSNNTYDIVNGRIILRSAAFELNKKKIASYSDSNQALYAQANVMYSFDPIEIPLDNKVQQQPQIVLNNIQVGKSDVDCNIPVTKSEQRNTFALIFANENYRDEAPVKYACNDGKSVEKYFTQTLGIPESNIHLVVDATKNDIVRELEWLKQISSVYKDDLNVLVYYAGHGYPDEAGGSAYLIPVDGVSNSPRTLYSLSDFYKELGEICSSRTILFMDACFSGSIRGSGMLASARGIALKAKQEVPQNNMIVVAAAQGDETAWPYDEKGHGLFTYFFLKKLQESKGNVTLGQLADYVKEQVGKYSIVVNSKKQTPTVSFSPRMAQDWSQQKIK